MANWFITGISRGFGKILTEELLAQGHTVVGTTRDGTSDIKNDKLHVVTLDVTNAETTQMVIKQAAEKCGSLDYIVNNAGFGIAGAVEEVSRDEINKVFETNIFGTLNVIQAVLPTLRKQGKGMIINFSSVGGMVSLPGFGIYSATKFAVEALSEALALETKPLGLHVMIVEPGAFRTEFLTKDSIMTAAKTIDAYKETSGKTRETMMARNGKQPGDPKLGVQAIIKAATSANPPLRLPLGQDSIDRIRAKLQLVEHDIKQWEDTTTKTAFAA